MNAWSWVQLGKANCERRVELSFRKIDIVLFSEEQKDLNVHPPKVF